MRRIISKCITFVQQIFGAPQRDVVDPDYTDPDYADPTYIDPGRANEDDAVLYICPEYKKLISMVSEEEQVPDIEGAAKVRGRLHLLTSGERDAGFESSHGMSWEMRNICFLFRGVALIEHAVYITANGDGEIGKMCPSF